MQGLVYMQNLPVYVYYFLKMLAFLFEVDLFNAIFVIIRPYGVKL